MPRCRAKRARPANWGGDAQAELAEALQEPGPADLAAADAALAAGRPDDAATLDGFALDESITASMRGCAPRHRPTEGFEPVLQTLL